MALGKPLSVVQAGLSLLEDIDSSTGGFCAILSGDLVTFTYGSQWSRGVA